MRAKSCPLCGQVWPEVQGQLPPRALADVFGMEPMTLGMLHRDQHQRASDRDYARHLEGHPAAEWAAALADARQTKPCPTCEGCGAIAYGDDDGGSWTFWESLAPGQDLAVRAGLVRPVPCPDCFPAAHKADVEEAH